MEHLSAQALEARIVELESREAFQDDTIQALNDALVQQRMELDRVQLHLRELLRRFDEVARQLPGEVSEAPPPHY